MKPIGLYIHWPFCARICPYCDFTVAKNRTVDESSWITAFTEDLDRLQHHTERRPLSSVYFGGGTPSLMPPKIAEELLLIAEERFGFMADVELTVEANPDDWSRFETLRSIGFNRLSLGVQSLIDEELKFLGRNHTADEAQKAIKEAQQLFDRVSLDFIYALPDQQLADWRKRLSEITAFGIDHLSLYQLTIESETAFGRAAERGTLVPMPDDRAADFYELTQEVTVAAGLPAYEVSNHARAGAEAVHNSLYWKDAEWIAIGPGAHGRIERNGVRRATTGAPVPAGYPSIQAADRIAVEELDAVARTLEVLSSGLRPTAGLELERLGSLANSVLERAGPLIEEGLLGHGEGRLFATEKGRLVLDQLTAFLANVVDDDET